MFCHHIVRNEISLGHVSMYMNRILNMILLLVITVFTVIVVLADKRPALVFFLLISQYLRYYKSSFLNNSKQ